MREHTEPHTPAASGTGLNWLRASVLGANDGIVSVASIVVGVAGASSSPSVILMAGIAGLTAGALSMAAGEYVSVSAQRDTERALIAQEKRELREEPHAEFDELVGLYEDKGLSHETAHAVATELTAHDALAAHAEVELHTDPDNLTNPWQAAFASAISFISGGIVPVLAVIFSPDAWRLLITFVAVLVALGITGTLGAQAGGANKVRATTRVVLGGAFAMLITFGIGKLFGVSGI